MRAINSFSGPYDFLSNFSSSTVALDGHVYPTVEHAFQAAKTVDPVERMRIRACPTPGQAKRQGRRVTLRPDWEQIKERVMLELLRQKFQIPHLDEKLQATGDAELIEGNHWGDTYWGVDRQRGGQNRLGMLLMQVRSERAYAWLLS